MSTTARIRGIFVPFIVPLDERGCIHEHQLRRYIDWLIDHGVDGLYPNGSTGEFTRFTAEERRRIIEISVDQAQGRVPVLAGAAEANIRETLRACDYYAGLGVRAVAIVSPFYYRMSPGNVYEYFKAIGCESPVDVTLYNIPMFASPIDVATLKKLSEECPRIVAIKDSSGDIAQMQRMIAAVKPLRPDFSFLCGWDPALFPMLLIGCDGGTNAVAGVAPELICGMYDLILAGNLAAAQMKQERITKLFDPMVLVPDFPEGIRVAAKLRGIQLGSGRMPLCQEAKSQLIDLARRVESELIGLGLLPRITDSGGPVVAGNIISNRTELQRG